MSEEEKDAILDYLGGVGTLDEDTLDRASSIARNQEAVYSALLDILQKNDSKPDEEYPTQPASMPQESASGDPVKDVIRQIIGE